GEPSEPGELREPGRRSELGPSVESGGRRGGGVVRGDRPVVRSPDGTARPGPRRAPVRTGHLPGWGRAGCTAASVPAGSTPATGDEERRRPGVDDRRGEERGGVREHAPIIPGPAPPAIGAPVLRTPAVRTIVGGRHRPIGRPAGPG